MRSDLGADLGVTGNTATSPMQRHYAPVGGWGPADWIPERPAWQADAACRGMNPDLFYSELGDSTVEAKMACRGCPVRDDCLEYALAHNEKHGIWGAMSERQRRRIRRDRAREARRRRDPLAPDDPRHGTYSTYVGFKCRCEACRAANAAYQRKYQAR